MKYTRKINVFEAFETIQTARTRLPFLPTVCVTVYRSLFDLVAVLLAGTSANMPDGQKSHVADVGPNT